MFLKSEPAADLFDILFHIPVHHIPRTAEIFAFLVSAEAVDFLLLRFFIPVEIVVAGYMFPVFRNGKNGTVVFAYDIHADIVGENDPVALFTADVGGIEADPPEGVVIDDHVSGAEQPDPVEPGIGRSRVHTAEYWNNDPDPDQSVPGRNNSSGP